MSPKLPCAKRNTAAVTRPGAGAAAASGS